MLALILDYTHVNVVLFLFIFHRIRVCTKKKVTGDSAKYYLVTRRVSILRVVKTQPIHIIC